MERLPTLLAYLVSEFSDSLLQVLHHFLHSFNTSIHDVHHLLRHVHCFFQHGGRWQRWRRWGRHIDFTVVVQHFLVSRCHTRSHWLIHHQGSLYWYIHQGPLLWQGLIGRTSCSEVLSYRPEVTGPRTLCETDVREMNWSDWTMIQCTIGLQTSWISYSNS